MSSASQIAQKSVVIGCDSAAIMADVLNSLKSKTNFLGNIVSVTRVVDVIGISKSVSPDLIILCFDNNQNALKDVIAHIKRPEIPILCLTERNKLEVLVWDRSSIVFTFPVTNLQKEDSLKAQIQSIFLLKKNVVFQDKSTDRNPASISQFSESRNLSRYVMELDQKIETLMKVKERIADLYPQVNDPIRVELSSIVNSIKLSINDNKLWEDFKLYFEKTNPNFLLVLSEKHPELTIKDLKYCCYLKMNMTNNDIHNLLGINQESVRTHKFRLKKKMALPKDLDLVNYLRFVA